MTGAVAGRPVMIESALNGVSLRHRNPHVPYSPQEIADDAVAATDAGASTVHFHVRDPADGAWSHDVATYAEVFRLVRARRDVLLWPTFAGGGDPKQRYRHIVELAADAATRPDFALVDPGSVNLVGWDPAAREVLHPESVYRNSYATSRYFLEVALDLGLRPTLQIFDASFLRAALVFLDQGLLRPPLVLKLYFGGPEMPFGLPPTLVSVEAYRAMLDGVDACWFVATMGGSVLPLVPVAVALGGHVRIGLEDYHHASFGAPTNAALVERVTGIIEAMGARVASVADAREQLGIQHRGTDQNPRAMQKGKP